MRESKKQKKRDPLPDEFPSLEAAGEFWDTHDSGDYEEYMIPVPSDTDLSPDAHHVAITDRLMRQVRKLASRQGVPAETLINLWVSEKVTAATERPS